MPQDKFLIAPINSGMQTDLKPWLIMDDAFQELNNVYTFRGRVRKRAGGRLLGTTVLNSRFRIKLGTTNGAGGFAGTVPGTKFLIGQQFSIGVEIFTVYQLGLPGATLHTGVGTATFNTTTGALVVVGAPIATDVYFYPNEPVMGLSSYENGTAINNEPFYGFDTQFAYRFSAGAWDRSGTVVNPIWHGDNLDYYWTCSWQGATPNLSSFFVTNFQVTNYNGAGVASDDPLWYTQDGTTWNTFIPYFNPGGGAPATGPFVKTCRLIVAFKDRLLLLNTVENNNAGGLGTNTNYPNRCRFSANASPFAANAWYEPNVTDSAGLSTSTYAGGGWIDATTDEEIISAEFIKDRLIVYFERSTWELAYTHNQVQPFLWQKLNTELGVESTFSVVPFDKVVLGIGDTGVHACNGSNVERVDYKIPDQVFQISNTNSGVKRTAGIRDFFTELVYWAYRSTGNSLTYPNKILVYNYRNMTWALNSDCITAFGHFNQQVASTWANINLTWAQSNMTWASGSITPLFSQVVAGNQQGYTFILDSNVSRNAPVMQITNLFYSIAPNPGITATIIDHTLVAGDYIAIEGAQGVADPAINNTGYIVYTVIDKDNVVLYTANNPTGYTGGGQATRISKIEILTKQWNPYIDKATNFSINKIDFAVEKTSEGEVTVDYSTSSSYYSTLLNSVSLQGNGVLETFPYALVPFEQLQTRLWHTIYFDTQGQCIQLYIYQAPDQLWNLGKAWEDFQIEGMILYTQPTGRVE